MYQAQLAVLQLERQRDPINTAEYEAVQQALATEEGALKREHSRVAEEKTASGIIIPDSAQEKPMQGKIVAAGSGARDETGKIQPLDVKEGDVVLFGKWSGTEVKLDGKDLLIMKESDIMGIMG